MAQRFTSLLQVAGTMFSSSPITTNSLSTNTCNTPIITVNSCFKNQKLYDCLTDKSKDFSRKFHSLLLPPNILSPKTYTLEMPVDQTDLRVHLSRQSGTLWLGVIAIVDQGVLWVEYEPIHDRLTLTLLGPSKDVSTCRTPIVELNDCWAWNGLDNCNIDTSRIFSEGVYTFSKWDSCVSKARNGILRGKLAKNPFSVKMYLSYTDPPVWQCNFYLEENLYRVKFGLDFKNLEITSVNVLSSPMSLHKADPTCNTPVIEFDSCSSSSDFFDCFRKEKEVFSQEKFHVLLPRHCDTKPSAYMLQARIEGSVWWTTLSQKKEDPSVWIGRISTFTKMSTNSLEIQYRPESDSLTLGAGVPFAVYLIGFFVDENPVDKTAPDAECYQTHFRVHLADHNGRTGEFEFDYDERIYHTDDPDIFYFSSYRRTARRHTSTNNFTHGSCEKNHFFAHQMILLTSYTTSRTWKLAWAISSTNVSSTYFIKVPRLILTCRGKKAQVTYVNRVMDARSSISGAYANIPACESKDIRPVFLVYAQSWLHEEFIEHNCDSAILTDSTESSQTMCGTCSNEDNTLEFTRFLIKFEDGKYTAEHVNC